MTDNKEIPKAGLTPEDRTALVNDIFIQVFKFGAYGHAATLFVPLVVYLHLYVAAVIIMAAMVLDVYLVWAIWRRINKKQHCLHLLEIAVFTTVFVHAKLIQPRV
jgi:membrane protein implicated in regulation of membrane protease activity